MARGLEQFLNQIRRNPSPKLISRYIALAADISDEIEKARRILDLAEVLAPIEPKESMRLCQMVHRVNPSNVRALKTVMRCLERLGKLGKAEVVENEIARLEKLGRTDEIGGNDPIHTGSTIDFADFQIDIPDIPQSPSGFVPPPPASFADPRETKVFELDAVPAFRLPSSDPAELESLGFEDSDSIAAPTEAFPVQNLGALEPAAVETPPADVIAPPTNYDFDDEVFDEAWEEQAKKEESSGVATIIRLIPPGASSPIEASSEENLAEQGAEAGVEAKVEIEAQAESVLEQAAEQPIDQVEEAVDPSEHETPSPTPVLVPTVRYTERQESARQAPDKPDGRTLLKTFEHYYAQGFHDDARFVLEQARREFAGVAWWQERLLKVSAQTAQQPKVSSYTDLLSTVGGAIMRVKPKLSQAATVEVLPMEFFTVLRAKLDDLSTRRVAADFVVATWPERLPRRLLGLTAEILADDYRLLRLTVQTLLTEGLPRLALSRGREVLTATPRLELARAVHGTMAAARADLGEGSLSWGEDDGVKALVAELEKPCLPNPAVAVISVPAQMKAES